MYGNKKGEEELMNSALNSTLSRTINTSLDVVLLTIFLLAVTTSKIWFALMVGVVVGTYSSIFIATPASRLSKRLTK